MSEQQKDITICDTHKITYSIDFRFKSSEPRGKECMRLGVILQGKSYLICIKCFCLCSVFGKMIP